jgi:hypothetical protein
MKIGDIKGTAIVGRTESTMVATELLQAGGSQTAVGLLLPAVQKVREAAATAPARPGSLQAVPQAPQLIGLLLPAVQKVREAAARTSRTSPGDIASPNTAQTAGLLLPAVQKVREAAARGAGGAVALHIHSVGSANAMKSVQQSSVLNVSLGLPDGSSVTLGNAILFDVNPSGKGIDIVIGFEKSSQ